MNVQTHPNGIVPLPTSGQGSGGKGGKVARAAQIVWDNLSRTDFKQAGPLAEDAALELGIKAESVVDHLSRMAREGFIEVELRPVETMVVRGGRHIDAKRLRKFIRIASS